MKKFCLLFVASLLAATTFAQQQLATLNHNDSITVFYGLSALQQAHTAAVNGDIITLGSGTFDAVNITKAVTLRGAGAWVDSATGVQTTVRNEFSINIDQDSVYALILEGIEFINKVTIQKAYNPQFIKCWFEDDVCLDASGNHIMRNATFVNCDLKRWQNTSNSSNGWSAQSTQFLNSVIRASAWDYSPDVFMNCILHQIPITNEMLSRMFTNCVLYYDYTSSTPSGNSTTSHNCIFIQMNNNGYADNLFSGHEGHTLWNTRGWNSVFKSTGYYELTDSIATTCIGTDGSQIGIYGGAVPFNKRVTNPAIRSITVGQRSTADGKLAVDIEVVSDND